ncbi:hypothetical protein FB451DRAFT_433485 [Mycena latifolia]|nr:hypothetical protein FB451DRAFT_433485 [Mycena latifolia]
MPFSPLPQSSPQLRDRSTQLEGEIRNLRAHLAELVAEHEFVQSKLKSIVYPILQIPSEITAEIFLWCLLESIATSPIRIADNLKSAPMQLASVCRDWRDIAFSTPKLWRFLAVSLNASTHIANLERRFSLCGNCPLSLDLFYARPYFTRLGTSATVPLEVVNRHCRQWETVKIDLMDRDAALLHNIKGRLPLLRQLTVSVYGESLGNAFSEAPNLYSLDVTVINTSARALSPNNFPWAQLTVFRGEGLSVEDCFHVLQLTPHLEYCTFSGWFGDDDGLPDSPLNLPSLRSLSLLNPESFGWFLGALTLPGLEDLRLSLLGRQIPSFCDFISRSSCSLKKLGLRTSSLLSYESLLKLWEAVPMVTHIGISPGIFSDQMTRLLLENKNVLPNLLEVVVDGKGQDMNHQQLVDMLRSRQHPDSGNPSSIQSLGFLSSQDWDMPPDIIFQLKSIVNDGMKIQMDVTVPLHTLASS